MARRLLVALVLAAGLATVPSSPAGADPDGAACTVAATFGYAPGLTVVPAAQVVTGAMALNCLAFTDDAGAWTLTFAGGSTESCSVGFGTVGWVAPSVSPEGPVVGGGFTYARVNSVMVLEGTIPVPGVPEVHTFAAVLAWTPTLPFNCVTVPIVAATAVGAGVIAD